MRKLIITIACAFVAQAQGEEYNWRLQRELRNLEDQQDEIIEQNEKIAKQNERLANQLRSDEFQRQLDAERIERQRSVERSIEDRRIQSERIKREVSEMNDGELEAHARALGLKPDTIRFGPVKKPEPAPLPPIDTQALLPAGSTTVIFK